MQLPNRRLYHRIEWNVELLTETPMYIGGRKEKNRESLENKEGSTLNKSLTTSDQSFFIIPGSSLRGVCRSFAYYVLMEVLNNSEQCEEILNDLFGYVSSDQKQSAKKGRIWFADAYIQRTKQTKVGKHITPIDRFQQSPICPLRFESIAPNQRICVRFTIENAKIIHLGIIALFLRELKRGQITFGGNTSRGFGYVKLRNIHTIISVYDTDGDYVKTIDNVNVPIHKNWQKRDELIFTVWESNDLDEGIEWLKQGVESIRMLSEKVIK
ncbi:CRISPR-associated RAMP protein, family [Anoxybacillus thermarum]|uniref:CRISPR-associated RAMP protein, family n=1 Tax=Anoxybacillus thermarum TaxID=404937 RepID=A0A0D0Q969_9BACL|nr:RAMP superfamily CRISPR-associated protein [Anoxybacillus thermarum]KIQ94508.1 CRISPR-associated RAMP protein, family [Anoxybacillus thermarum]